MIFAWGIGVALIAAYLRIGWRHALADRERAWQRARLVWGPRNREYVLESVRWAFVRMLAFWPVILGVRAFDGALRAGDPVVIRRAAREEALRQAECSRQISERNRRTAELERWHDQWEQDHPELATA